MEACPADIRPGDQLTIICACGHRVSPATARWPEAVRRTSLAVLVDRHRFKCQRCGGRNSRVIVTGFYGEGSRTCYRFAWPQWDLVGTAAGVP